MNNSTKLAMLYDGNFETHHLILKTSRSRHLVITSIKDVVLF